MKNTLTFLKKMSLAGSLLMLHGAVFAQVAPTPTVPIVINEGLDVGTINDDATDVTFIADAVLFLSPDAGGSSITLQASPTDDDGNTFTDYAWFLVNEAGVTLGTPLSTTNTLTRSGADLQPGYHRFRVFGYINTPDVDCQSDEYQDIIIFILNPLSPTASPVDTEAITEYCEGEEPAGTFELSATVAFAEAYANPSFPNPAIGQMEKTFTWYAMYDDGVGGPATRQDIGTITTQIGETLNVPVNYADYTAPGTYTFYVEVAYSDAIKDNGARGEGHGFWTAQVMNDAEEFQLNVTVKPGRPTITIVDSND